MLNYGTYLWMKLLRYFLEEFPYCSSDIIRLKMLRNFSGGVYKFSLWNIYTAVGTIYFGIEKKNWRVSRPNKLQQTLPKEHKAHRIHHCDLRTTAQSWHLSVIKWSNSKRDLAPSYSNKQKQIPRTKWIISWLTHNLLKNILHRRNSVPCIINSKYLQSQT
jgi:hypothetical protein